jgi:hypothetical protein
VWKEKLYGDLMVRHLVHKYLVPIPLDNNVGFSFIFDSEEGLREYIDKRSQDGNIKEGSLRLTFNGAYQLGILILDSLIEYIIDNQDSPSRIPHRFSESIRNARASFQDAMASKERWYRSSIFHFDLVSLSREYPFESSVAIMILDYIHSLGREAALHENVS